MIADFVGKSLGNEALFMDGIVVLSGRRIKADPEGDDRHDDDQGNYLLS